IYGGSRGDAAYNLFKTNMASKAELRRVHNSPEFCRAADLVLAAANAPAKPTLKDFVAGVQVADVETPVSSRSVAATVTLAGVQALPSVTPRPRPPQPDDPPETAVVASATPSGGGVKVGSLTCNVASGFGFILGSKKELKCTFANNAGSEHYTGTFSKYG